MNDKTLEDIDYYWSTGKKKYYKEVPVTFATENKKKIANAVMQLLDISESDIEDENAHLAVIRTIKLKLMGI